MHHIYTTKSIVLKREPSNDSAYFRLLTFDFGLITARAQGVRTNKSRLKGALQEFSLSTVAYVHGKAGWKITTAIPERNFWNDIQNIKKSPFRRPAEEAGKIIAHISNTLTRLITGEEKSPNIFSIVEKSFSLLAEGNIEPSLIEVIALARILHILGYIASDEHTSFLFQNLSDFSLSLLSLTSTHKAFIIRAINKGLRESSL